MGLKASKPSISYPDDYADDYELFLSFLQEYFEPDSSAIIPFNQLVASYWSYIVYVRKQYENRNISYKVHNHIKKYIDTHNDYSIFGFYTTVGFQYNNVMISGMRQVKVPLSTSST